MRLREQRGMTLLELVGVMAIMAILMTIATLNFRSYRERALIDSQAKEIYADLMKVRSEALFRKEDRAVKVTATNQLSVYGKSDASGPVLWQKTYSSRKAISSNNADPLVFDSQGVVNSAKAFCVDVAGNGAGVDAVVISTTSLMLGKLTGGACSSANIEPK